MSDSESRNVEQVVVFTLEEQNYAISISSVLEIIRQQEITTIPNTPYFLEGIINVRGQVVPVMDLRKRFGLQEGEYTQSTRIIMVNTGGSTVGLVVDSVTEVLQIPSDQIKPAPSTVKGVDQSFIQGIALIDEKMIIILQVDNVLHDSEHDALSSFMQSGELASSGE